MASSTVVPRSSARPPKLLRPRTFCNTFSIVQIVNPSTPNSFHPCMIVSHSGMIALGGIGSRYLLTRDQSASRSTLFLVLTNEAETKVHLNGSRTIAVGTATRTTGVRDSRTARLDRACLHGPG